MSANIICILIAIVVYLAGMVAIGVYYSKGQSDTHEFYLGGRKLGPIVTALSTEASDMSAYLLMGVPGLAFFCGVAEASWTAIGLAIGTYLNWLFVAKRLRRYSVRLGALTLPEYISKRFYDDTKLIELLGAITIIVFYVPYTASGFSACGKLFGTLFGFDYVPTMIISAAVIVAYTACGGFKAASVTSLVQSLIMVFALAVVLIFGINSVGGWEQVVANAKAIPGYLSFTASTNIMAAEAGEFGTLKIISTLAWSLGYFGMPHVILHFMAIEDENKLKLSRRVATIWVVVSLSVAVIIGIVLGFLVAIVRCTNEKTGKLKLANAICKIYLTVLRGTPVLVQLMIIYFVIFMPIGIDKFLAAVICFGLNSGAYVAEIVRGGIMSIDAGQMEAGRSLGFGYAQTMLYIIMPQTFKAVLPALANEFIVLLKETSVSAYIGLNDLARGGDIIRGVTYSAFMPMIAVALVYLVVVVFLQWLVGKLERRLRSNER